MKMTVIGIFDRKAQVYISLEPTPNIAVATRQFQEIVNKGDGNPINKWPSDFELWDLGTFDTESGYVEARGTADDAGKTYFDKKLIVTGDALKN